MSEPGTFKYNIKNNKKYILYYTGVLIGGALRVVADQVVTQLPPTWWGIAIVQTLNLLLIFYGFIAPFIFGGRETIDELQKANIRIKAERKIQGEKISNLESKNSALEVSSTLRGQLLEENGITALKYNFDGTYGVDEVKRQQEINALKAELEELEKKKLEEIIP